MNIHLRKFSNVAMKEDFWIFLCFGQSNMAGQVHS